MNQTPSYQNHPVAGLHQARPSPSVTPQTSYNAAQYQQRPNYPNNPNYNGATPNPAVQQASQPVRWQQPQTQAPTPAQPTAYNRPAQPAQTQYAAQPSQAAQLQRGTEVYTLADTSNMSIPKEIRDQFPQDEQGRILFFATPPLDNTQTITGKTAVEKDHPLEHSESYVQSLKKRKSDAMLGTDKMDTDETKITASKRLATSKPEIPASVNQAFSILANQISTSTNEEYKEMFGKDWREQLVSDLKHARDRNTKEHEKDLAAERQRDDLRNSHISRNDGQFASNSQGYITGWEKDFFTGTYLDDHDSRLPF